MILLAGAIIIALAAAIAALAAPGGTALRVAGGVVLVGAAAFGLLLLAWTHYDLGSGRLRVQHGLLRRVIPVRDIRAVTHIHSLASSAVLSRDRIRLEYGHGRAAIEISPSDTGRFLSDLRAMSPGIRVQ